MKKNIVKMDEIFALIDKMRNDGELGINWETLLQAVAQWKGKKEANKMKKNRVVYVELADYSYHCDDCDICDPWGWFGHTYVRKPDPKDRTRYADRPVTHIEMRPDVVVKYNGPDGADVEWAADMPCPFVFMPDW